jgi:glycosyltransferase involved in cell wall biosynthesis
VLVSVIVPTHDHGPTLRPAIASALAQTHDELELLIVGDGVPAEADAVVRELEREHDRVRAFRFEKGDRHGEAHRDWVIRHEARGECVLYLSDDDLWLPDHVEALVAALREADFAAGTAARVSPDGSYLVIPHDLSHPETRALMLAEPRHYNHVPLALGGHTIEAYRRRAEGWAPAPAGIWTDLHFWRGFVGDEACRCRSVQHVTTLNFDSPQREGMTIPERVAELEAALTRMSTPEGLAAIRAEIDAAYREQAVASDLDYHRVLGYLEAAERHADDLRQQLAERDRRIAELSESDGPG